MKASEIIRAVTLAGGTITAENCELKLAAPKALPDALMADIRANKQAIMDEINQPDHGRCYSCGADTEAMLTVPGEPWCWCCLPCFEKRHP